MKRRSATEGRPLDNGPVAQTIHCAMGTVMTHKAFGLHAQDCLRAVCKEVARIEGLLSRFVPASEISCLNRSAGIKRERLSRETYQVLSEAVAFSRDFPGCFDMTIQPLVTLWSRARDPLAEPDASCIRQVLPLVNYRDLVLDPRERTAGLGKVGQAVELGGIGKGFAADRILEIY
jgi:thiamine biosynthesis lipoprotein